MLPKPELFLQTNTRASFDSMELILLNQSNFLAVTGYGENAAMLILRWFTRQHDQNSELACTKPTRGTRILK